MTKHSEAPWKWFSYPDGRMLLAGMNEAVIHCPDAPMCVSLEDQALIATAPELLACLKLLTQDSRFNLAIGGNPNAVDALVKRVDEAIAKAEGR